MFDIYAQIGATRRRLDVATMLDTRKYELFLDLLV